MKKIYIFFLLLSCLSLNAQNNSWFTDGQQWYYHYGASFEIGYEKLTIVGDTLIENKNCKKIETIRTVHDAPFGLEYTASPYYQFTYEENDSVYCQFQDEFHLVYDFNMEVGDRMMFNGILYGISDSVGYIVDSIGVMDIDGTALRFQKVSILRDDFTMEYDTVGQSYMIETIGMVALEDDDLKIGYFNLMRGFGTLGLIEESWSFRCFSNVGIDFHPQGDWCDKLYYNNWLNNDASWCYSRVGMAGNSEININLVGPEVHETYNPSILWKTKRETRSFDNWTQSTNVYLDSFYLYETNGILYHVSLDLSESTELLNLNWQVNDTIQVMQDEYCSESYIAVDSVNNIVVDGESLRRLFCTKYVNSDSWGNNPIVENFTITERIGSFSMFIREEFTCATDQPTTNLKQYNDNDINYIENGDGTCFTLNVSNEEILESNTSISPNPATSIIRIQSDEKIKEINIFTYSGQLMNTYKNDFEKIDISKLNSGVFIMEIQFDNQQTLYKRLLKH